MYSLADFLHNSFFYFYFTLYCECFNISVNKQIYYWRKQVTPSTNLSDRNAVKHDERLCYFVLYFCYSQLHATLSNNDKEKRIKIVYLSTTLVFSSLFHGLVYSYSHCRKTEYYPEKNIARSNENKKNNVFIAVLYVSNNIVAAGNCIW